MSSLNKAMLIGHLGKDVKVANTPNGSKVVTFSVATSETWKDKNSGERKERTEWHNVVIFNDGLCTIAERYLKKGSKVYVEGEIRTRKYQDNAGNDRWSTEIVLSQFRGALTLLDKAEGRPAPQEDAYGATTTRSTSTTQPSASLDDDIPF